MMEPAHPMLDTTTPNAPSVEGFEELRAGHLGVIIASSPAEIDAAQALRYRVFYDEMGAKPCAEAARTLRDPSNNTNSTNPNTNYTNRSTCWRCPTPTNRSPTSHSPRCHRRL